MWYDEALGKRFADASYSINKLYCDKHGYDLIHSNKLSGKDFRNEFPWEKVPMILNYIGPHTKYDYVIWIDADAHFYVDRGPITDVIDMYKDRDIILSQDLNISAQFRHWVCNVQYPNGVLPPQWSVPRVQTPDNLEHEINTGIMIIKNTQNMLDIVNWWLQRGIELPWEQSLLSAWDQGVLRNMWLDEEELTNLPGGRQVRGIPLPGHMQQTPLPKNRLRDHGVVLPYGILQHFDLSTDADMSPYVRHFCGQGKDCCTDGMLEYLEKISAIKTDY